MPSNLVGIVVLRPVPLSRTVTVAPGTDEPVASITVPAKLAVLYCASSGTVQTSAAISRLVEAILTLWLSFDTTAPPHYISILRSPLL